MDTKQNLPQKVAHIHFLRKGNPKTRILCVNYRNPSQLAELIHRKIEPMFGETNQIIGVTDKHENLNWGAWNPQWAHWVFDNGRFDVNVLLEALSASSTN